MAKFDPFAIKKRIDENKDPSSKKETTGTKIVRLIMGLVIVFMIWSLVDYYKPSRILNITTIGLLCIGYGFYAAWVYKKQ